MKLSYYFTALLGLFSIFINLQALEDTRKLENLGTAINSSCNDLNPVITSDGKMLFFCRDECPGNNDTKQDIWYSTMQKDGSWAPAIKLGPPLNNEYNNFVCSVTPGGNTILLGNIYNSEGTMGKGVSISYKSKTGWSFPEKLNIKEYYNMSEYGGFYMADNEKTLLLAVERKDSYGKKDLYVSFLQNDGTWSIPKNLGPKVNSIGEEISPFIASDNITLYFSSDRQGGFGDADIFLSRRLDDTWQNWSEPENLGAGINTSGWDAYYKTSAAGDYAYCVSATNTHGKSDIFRIAIPKAQKPKAVMLVKGRVTSFKTGAPLDAQIIYETLPEGKESGIARTEPRNGFYKMTLPSGFYFSYRGIAKGYIGANEDLDLRKMENYAETQRDLMLIPASDSLLCVRNIFFQSAKYVLTDESLPERQRLVKFLKDSTETIVEVSGYTDDRGSEELNKKISENRAKNAVDYLMENGIPKERIVMKNFAKTAFVWDNDTDYGRQLNRRVEFLVYKSEWRKKK